MKRITIFAHHDCPRAKAAKAFLRSRNIVYTETHLSSHLSPQKMNDMRSLSKRVTEPQVFCDNAYIGGVKKLTTVVSDNNIVYEFRILPSNNNNATTVTGREPTVPSTNNVSHNNEQPSFYHTSHNSMETSQEREGSIILEVTKKLIEVMPRNTLKWNGKTYNDAFKGSDGVKALMTHFGINDKDDALRIGRSLQERKIIDHVTRDQTFGDNFHYFQLQPFRDPRIMNSFLIWTDPVDSDAMSLISRLKQIADMIPIQKNARQQKDSNYWTLEKAVCELQGVTMAYMDDKTKLAFGINLYNLMIRHAFIKVGVPTTSLERSVFLESVSYDIGGDVLTLNDLEHGVLRANAVPPYQLNKRFSISDPRRRLALMRIDPRFHFALCDGVTCSKTTVTYAGIDKELDDATVSFCDLDDNVFIDEDEHEIRLSTMFKLYLNDFASSVSKLPMIVLTYLQGEKKDMLQRMINNSSRITATILISFNDDNPITDEKTTLRTQYSPTSCLEVEKCFVNSMFSF